MQSAGPRVVEAAQGRSMSGGHPMSDTIEIKSAPKQHVSKTGLVLELLSRTDGATIEQIVEATGWLAHSTRAALTGLRTKGHFITSENREGAGRADRVEVVCCAGGLA